MQKKLFATEDSRLLSTHITTGNMTAYGSWKLVQQPASLHSSSRADGQGPEAGESNTFAAFFPSTLHSPGQHCTVCWSNEKKMWSSFYPVHWFLKLLLRYNSHNIKLTLLMCTRQWFFMWLQSCQHHRYQLQHIFITLRPISNHSFLPVSSLLATTIYFFLNFIFLE